MRLFGLTKHYGSTVAVDGVELAVANHEFVTLLGPSGSGKTTVLRMVAGYVEPTAGRVVIGGNDVGNTPPERRDIGMVFQSYALFPHMTVSKNVAFGLERRHVNGPERDMRVKEALELVRLGDLGGRYPRQLSGGQQQRVALARALVVRPTLLLLDEPLSNLDAKLRGEVRLEIRRLQQELGITTLLVTHDQEEALTVSDRIAIMHEGCIQQVAPPAELYNRPANRFVADFVGKMNFLQGSLVGEAAGGMARYRLAGGETVLASRGPERAILAVRPESVRLGSLPEGEAANSLAGRVEYRVFLGELTELGIRLDGGGLLMARSAGGTEIEPGCTVRPWWPPEKTTALEM